LFEADNRRIDKAPPPFSPFLIVSFLFGALYWLDRTFPVKAKCILVMAFNGTYYIKFRISVEVTKN
jgi:hypothetical protein